MSSLLIQTSSGGRQSSHRYSLQEQDLAYTARPANQQLDFNSSSPISASASTHTSAPKAFLSASQRLKPSLRKASFADHHINTAFQSSSPSSASSSQQQQQSSIFSLNNSASERNRRMSVAQVQNASAFAELTAAQLGRRGSIGSGQARRDSSGQARRDSSTYNGGSNLARSGSVGAGVGDGLNRSQSADASSRRNSTRRSSLGIGSGFDLNSLFTANDNVLSEELQGMMSSQNSVNSRRRSSMAANSPSNDNNSSLNSSAIHR